MKERTLRPVRISMPPTRSSRMVVWNLRRIVMTRSVSPSVARRRSALVMLSWVTQMTVSSRMVVRALVGPRPVYSATRRTTSRLMSALREPEARSVCGSFAATVGLRSDHLCGSEPSASQRERENPTGGEFRSVSGVQRPGSTVGEAEQLRRVGELEEPLDVGWSRDKREGEPVGSRAGIPLEDHPQATRVEKAHPAQIERDLPEAGRHQLGQVLLDHGSRGHVDLTDGAHADPLALRLEFAAERVSDL